MIPLYDRAAHDRVTDANTALVMINLLILPLEYITNFDGVLHRLGLVPEFLIHPLSYANYDGLLVFATLITSMFIHAGAFHVLLNMYVLMVFGPALEDYLGHVRYLLFYFISGICAGLFAIYFAAGSMIPIVGASGAIAGVLGAHLILFPRARLRTVLPLLVTLKFFDVPSIIYLMLWFGLQLLGAIRSAEAGASGGIAFAPHLAGFMFGMMLGPIMAWRPAARKRRVRPT
ncbi:MAG: rhomboid family intramembrane serine protease [Candidatus Binataceae bacterium]|nr:rhomboid family intramembrane serine protease [Candidatus Binataceae bacterium]